MRKTPQQKENDIKAHLLVGRSYSDIVRTLNVSKSLITKVKKRNNLFVKNNKSGRKKTFTNRDKRKIVYLVWSQKLDNAVKVHKFVQLEFGIQCSAQTVRNLLRNSQLLSSGNQWRLNGIKSTQKNA